MIAEVEIYRGTFPGNMLIRLTELRLADKELFSDESASKSLVEHMRDDVAMMMHTMYKMQSDVTTCELDHELRICAGPICDPDHVAKMDYQDRLHKVVVDPRVLPQNFKAGTYKCSLTLSVGNNFWIRDKKHPLIMSTLDQSKCRAVLNLLQRTGDIEPRPLTLWEYWKQEFRRTFIDED
jgi:hypothetical protein